MNPALNGRLYNAKYEQACGHLEGEDEYTKEVVQALAAMLGNPGWFGGHMAIIANAACRSIGAEFDDEDDGTEINVHVADMANRTIL